ncbi:unnamed protein product [Closterium sp. NIES-54]
MSSTTFSPGGGTSLTYVLVDLAAPLVALPCPARRAALPVACRPALPDAPPCWPPRTALPCPSCHLAGSAPPSPARRAALLATALPCPARAPPRWPPRRPALPACCPGGRRATQPCPRTTLPCPRAALLAAALPCQLRRPALAACRSPLAFQIWLYELQLYLQSESRDGVSLFDHKSGTSLAPPETADSATRSHWLTRDATARLAVLNHLLLAERAHFGQHKTAKALFDAVVTLDDLITHLRTSDTHNRTALPTNFLDKNPPPMYITLYFIVTHLPDSLRAVNDLLTALDPTDLTVDLLEKHLLAAETSIVTVGAARGTPRTPFFEGCSLKGKGGKSGGGGRGGGGGGGSGGGGGGGGGGSGGSGGGSGGFGGGGGGSGGGGGGGGGGSGSGGGGSGGGRGGAVQRGCYGGGQRQADIIALDYDAILAAMYALSVSAECECYLCVLLDPRLEAAALGASESALPGVHVKSGSSPLQVSPPVTPDSPVAPPTWSLPPLLPSPAPPCLPCVEGRQRAAPHSSSFPPTTAPLQTLHMDVWGPAHVSGEDRERYFLLVVDDYTRYNTVFPLRSKGEVPDVSIPWIRAVRLQLRERFREDLLVLSLHSYRGGEFSSDLLWDFCHGEGILHSFTLPASPQQNGVAERRIGLVMEVARTSMIHAAAPHFLWPFAVRYAAHQLNLWPRVKVTVDSGAARGAASRGAEPASAELGGAERASAERGGAEAEVTELGGADSEGAESGGVEPEGAEPGGTKPEGARPGVAKSEGAESRASLTTAAT